MGTKSRLTMVTEVLDNLGRLSTSTTRSGSQLGTVAVNWLNEAQLWIARQADVLYKLQYTTTSQGVKSYTLPTKLRTLLAAKLEDGVNSRPLIVHTVPEYFNAIPRPETYAQDRPLYMFVYKNLLTFDLFPIPSGAYTLTIFYTKYPSDLSSDSSTSEYTYMDDVLVMYATYKGFLMLGEAEESAVWLALAKDALKLQLNAEASLVAATAHRFKGFKPDTAYPLWYTEYHRNPLIMHNP